MSKEREVAREILACLGFEENVANFTNCMTRLRVNVYNREEVNIQKLEEIDGVIGVVEDETIQIILGPGFVNKVASEFQQFFDQSSVEEDQKRKIQEKNNTPFKNGLKKIGNVFIPLLPGLIASGLINGIVSTLINGGVDEANELIVLMKFIGGCIFTYLGVFVGINAAKEFGGTPVLGGIAGLLIINPALDTLDLTIMGEEVTAGRGGLIAVLISAWFMTVIERNVRKFIPSAVDIILTPLLTLLIVGISTMYIIQPLGGLLSEGILSILTAVLEIGGPLAGAVLAGTFLPLVMVGLHHGLIPLHMEFIQATGATPLLPILAMAGAGQVGAGLAILVKTKNERIKKNLYGALPVGFLGVGEPLLYGVTLPLGRPFITACLGAAVGGASQAVFATATKAVGISGLPLTLLVVDGKIILYLLGLLISYGAGFIFTYFFGYKEEMAQNLRKEKEVSVE
ncbi:PTS transporter subunit EIIC [Priestia endophytica]|uniref:PTS transporter subunit EIIC n=1 Tax=Priestia endophytica TaxID=135735 RepID=UPI00227F6C42|nr:PTS transporter subunit EIIC [Priestia endophytica]MCY8231084.1 PTS transporter subunit EIIC [Priestia endophytica]